MQSMRTRARFLRLFGGTIGVLKYSQGRLTFTNRYKERVLDTPATSVSEVRPSRIGGGGILTLRVGWKKYRFAMAGFGPLSPFRTNAEQARSQVNEWCEFLQAAHQYQIIPDSRPRGPHAPVVAKRPWPLPGRAGLAASR